MVSRERKTCTVDDCDKTYFSKGKCSMHYRRAERMAKGEEPKRYENLDLFLANDKVRGPEDLTVLVKGAVQYRADQWAAIVKYPRFDGTEGCAGMDLNLFYPEADKHVRPEVLDACNNCPFLNQCREWGLASEEHGVFGGLSARQRRRIRTARRQVLVNPINGKAVGLSEWDWAERLDYDATFTGGPTQDEEHYEADVAERNRANANKRWAAHYERKREAS